MNSIASGQVARELASRGVAFSSEIAAAATKYGISPRLLAAVAAQETGGPGSNSGRNIVGDAGHGHGVFQIDDRFHAFARSSHAMDPRANAEYAAHMISDLLRRFGGDVHKALSAYNSGDANAVGTVTQWQDGAHLSYADSVLRHYTALGDNGRDALADELRSESMYEQQHVNALASFSSLAPTPSLPQQTYSYRELEHRSDAKRDKYLASCALSTE